MNTRGLGASPNLDRITMNWHCKQFYFSNVIKIIFANIHLKTTTLQVTLIYLTHVTAKSSSVMLLLMQKWGYIDHFMENKFMISNWLRQSNWVLQVKLNYYKMNFIFVFILVLHTLYFSAGIQLEKKSSLQWKI
jgi:hypothetical protein